jgi:hypothetical protein
MLDLATNIAIISTVCAAIQTYFAAVQSVRLTFEERKYANCAIL